jgi:hypothetical protein
MKRYNIVYSKGTTALILASCNDINKALKRSKSDKIIFNIPIVKSILKNYLKYIYIEDTKYNTKFYPIRSQ